MVSKPISRRTIGLTIPTLLANNFSQIVAQIYQTSCSVNQDQLIWEDSNDGGLTLNCAFQCINRVSIQPNWCNYNFTFKILHHIPQVKDLLAATTIHVVSTIWFCRNQSRFQDKIFSLSQTLVRLKMDISLSGNQSKSHASSSIHDFTIIRTLN
ncbi:hypothetical protein Lal_00024118 [Lupinus albus]|nr:hypothetical protein Lal_00024118 [Lupinus albus]